jgi:hypothetical protein
MGRTRMKPTSVSHAAVSIAGAFVLTLLPTPTAWAVPATFAPAVSIPVGGEAGAFAVGDFNGDTDLDMAVVNRSSNTVSVVLGGAGGSFGAPTTYAVNSRPIDIAVGDFNGDSDPDLAVANFDNDGGAVDAGGVSVLLGGSGGSFGSATHYLEFFAARAIAVGDVNADSDPDLIALSYFGNSEVVLLGGADGTFAPSPTAFDAGSGAESVAVGDFNSDADLDLAVAQGDMDSALVFLGGEGDTFDAPLSFPTGDNPESVAVGDFNADSDPDLAVANADSDTISVLFGGTGGTFAPATQYPAGDRPNSVAVGDFDADSVLDLVTANGDSDSVSLLPGDAGGSFGVAMSFAVGDLPASVAVGDFNEDAKPDLAVANVLGGDVSELLNTTTIADSTDPTVTCSASPARLKANKKLITVTTTVSVTDEPGGSGTAGFTLTSAVSSQADGGLARGDRPDDIQGWTTGTPDTNGLLRAERFGGNRVYTLTYQGSDLAGNTQLCQATVTVVKGR